MFFVDQDQKPNSSEIYDLRTLGHATIVVEALKKKKMLMILFNVSDTSSLVIQGLIVEHRCVECGLEHSTSERTKARNFPLNVLIS